MKPRNFPGRKLRRQAIAKLNTGLTISEAEHTATIAPKDIRIRVGRARRTVEGLVNG